MYLRMQTDKVLTDGKGGTIFSVPQRLMPHAKNYLFYGNYTHYQEPLTQIIKWHRQLLIYYMPDSSPLRLIRVVFRMLFEGVNLPADGRLYKKQVVGRFCKKK